MERIIKTRSKDQKNSISPEQKESVSKDSNQQNKRRNQKNIQKEKDNQLKQIDHQNSQQIENESNRRKQIFQIKKTNENNARNQPQLEDVEMDSEDQINSKSSSAYSQQTESNRNSDQIYQNFTENSQQLNQNSINPLNPIKLQNKEKQVQKSTEEGYSGSSDQWFDEQKFNQRKLDINFDNANKHDYYFNSYSSHHIHEEMLRDTARTKAYQDAIEKNPIDFKDKIVMDIGCGTGILSIFAARAGAKHVYAIDNAEIALFAKEIVKQNGFEDKITVYKGKVEEIEFPFKEGEVDIILSEWMGYFLLYESMLDCVLDARDKFLNKKTGKMLPDRALMYCAAIEDSEFVGEKQNFWQDCYGVNMSIMTAGIFQDPIIDIVPQNIIVSDSCCVLDLDLVKMSKKDVEFSNFYELKMEYNDQVYALVFWFDVIFSDLQNPVTLTTSPYSKYTHWKQSVLYLERPLTVRRGDQLYGSLAIRQDRQNFRELNIKMSFHLDSQKGQQHFEQQYKFK